MKKSTLAIAALLTTLSTSAIVPVAYAEDAAAPAATCSSCKPACSSCKPACSSCKPADDSTGSDS